MRDSRLFGVWKSDKQRTMRELRARRDISEKSRQMIGGVLGKLEMRYTATRCYSTFDGHTLSAPYTVVAKDSSSVAIVSRDAMRREDTISHLHFEGSSYWVTAGTGTAREFFTRVTPPDGAKTAAPRPAKGRVSKAAAKRARG